MILMHAKRTIRGCVFLALGLGCGAHALAYFEDFFPAGGDPRTAAMGEITFAAPSEKNELNLFNLGNPCGAVFLPVENRLDYGVFRHESDAWPSNTHIDLAGTGGAYQGVLLRPDSHTALQFGTTAETYTHTYGDSFFYEGQHVHALAVGSVLGAYEVLPGLGVGFKYKYARPVQEVYRDSKTQQETAWDVGVGYRLGDALTLGLSAGYAVFNQNRGEFSLDYYGYTQWSNGSLIQVDEYWSTYRSTLESTFNQPHTSFQWVYKPMSAISVICWGAYEHAFRLDRTQDSSTSTQRVTGTGSIASDYTEYSSSAYTGQDENVTDKYTVRPMVQLSLGVSEGTQLDVGVHVKYERTASSHKSYVVSRDSSTTTRIYDNGYVERFITTHDVGTPRESSWQEDNYEYALGTWSWHSREKNFLIGGQYEHQKKSNTFSVGGEYWVGSALAVRVGAHIFSTSASQANTYTAGLGWEGQGYAVNFSYNWSDLGLKLYVQNMGLGVTVFL